MSRAAASSSPAPTTPTTTTVGPTSPADEPSSSSDDQTMVQPLLKAQSGNQQVLSGLVHIDYMFIGCGGTDRTMRPDQVVAALNSYANGDEAYTTAGVLDFRNSITQVSIMQRVSNNLFDCMHGWH